MNSQTSASHVEPMSRCRLWPARWAVVAAAALLGQLPPLPANGTPLDPSFGGGLGIVTTDLSGAVDYPYALAFQSDGKILAAGSCSAIPRMCVARYLMENGALDTAGFNAAAAPLSRGKRVLPAATAGEYVDAIAELPNGKILLAGRCTIGRCAIQLLPDGSDDASFGAGGVLALASFSAIWAIKVRPDGRVVIVGDCGDAMCALQLRTDSTPDNSFGTGGLRVLNHYSTPFGLNTVSESSRTVVILPDGKALLLGNCSSTMFDPTGTFVTTSTACAQRLLPDGTTDATYSPFPTGWRSFSLGGTLIAASGPMPEGQIMLGGSCRNGTVTLPCLMRILGSGVADPTFGTSGRFDYVPATLVGATNVYLAGMAVLSDGKIFVSASCSFAQALFCVLRHNSDGSLDTTFDVDGRDGHNVGSGGASPTAAALQADRKFVAIGSCQGLGGADFCLARYLPGPSFARNCTLDIDGDGKVLATTDMLMVTRVALGLTGAAVTSGVTFSAAATRNSWPLIREYLISHCAMNLP